MLKFDQNSKFLRVSRFLENFWKYFSKAGILKFWIQNWYQWPKMSGNHTQYVVICPKQQIPENFQIPRKFLQTFLENWNFEILSLKSISVTKVEWKWYPICWNWPKTANSWEFPDFQKISGKIPEIYEFWNSDFKINFSD